MYACMLLYLYILRKIFLKALFSLPVLVTISRIFQVDIEASGTGIFTHFTP